MICKNGVTLTKQLFFPRPIGEVVYTLRILIVGYKPFIDWLIKKSWYSNFQPINVIYRIDFVISIRDVNKFIIHCLIPYYSDIFSIRCHIIEESTQHLTLSMSDVLQYFAIINRNENCGESSKYLQHFIATFPLI